MSLPACIAATAHEVPSSGTINRHGVLVVACATVAMALGFGGLALTSVLIRPLEAEFGWSRADISLAYALATIGMAVGGLVWGIIADRVDIKILLAIGGIGMAVSLFVISAVQALWQIYAANIIFGGFGFAVIYAPVLAVSSEWFATRRGVVTGIVTAGGALGQGVLPFVANVLIDSAGWRLASLAIALAVLAVLALALPLISRPLATKQVTVAVCADVRRAGERLRLGLLAAAAFLCCACMGVPLVHMASFIGAICGSPAFGATSLLVAMTTGAIGRVGFGAIADRVGALPSYALASAIQTACVVVYPLLSDSASLIMLSAVFGFGFAGNMTCLVLCVRDTVPATRFGGSIGMVMLVAWTGMGAGGYVGGALFDLYGSYALSFALAAAAGVLNVCVLAAMIAVFSGKKSETAPR